MADAMSPVSKLLSDYIFTAKYANYLPKLQRRETWDECVDRVRDMHLRKYPHLEDEINWIFNDMVRTKKILPSARSLQFGGKAIESNNLRLFNCAAGACDRPRFFAEAFYLLLCGCGVGFSVQKVHTNKLPLVRGPFSSDYVFMVEDSIEGWAEALDALMTSYFNNEDVPLFDYSQIRPEGTLLKTSGGRAPGPKYLQKSLEQVGSILSNAIGRQLTSLECHDIVCVMAEAVLSGGIRRSSLLSLFDADDEAMLTAKMGNWFETAPWRRNANNSAAFVKGLESKDQFTRVFNCLREFGDPGFAFIEHVNALMNPCAEAKLLISLAGSNVSGFQFCNLTTINGSMIKHRQDFFSACMAASILGTLQAGYTDFKFLGKESKALTERDALLGVSICGVYEAADILLDPYVLRAGAYFVVERNKTYAKKIGINPAKRTTLLKPDGTSRLLLGGITPGIGPHHAEKYIRRVTANKNEVTFKYFNMLNPHMVVDSPYKDTDCFIEFPLDAGRTRTLSTTSAIDHLKDIRVLQENWVNPGSLSDERHSVSCTVEVKEHEWDEVVAFLWANKEYYAAVTFVPQTLDKAFPCAPEESIDSANMEKWKTISVFTPVDFSKMIELEDGTALEATSACEGNKCEIRLNTHT
jgi:ribonucleoside-triphosphate reductase